MNKEKLMKDYKMSDSQAGEAVRLLSAVKRALKNNAIYIKLDSVAISGMSRNISMYIVYKNEIYCLNWAFGLIFGDRLNERNHEVVMLGCGMDMLFEANYRLFRALCPQMSYQSYCRYKRL